MKLYITNTFKCWYLLLFSLLHLSLCFYSLRKKPNERPAYTELMVCSFCIYFLLQKKHQQILVCIMHITLHCIPAVMFSVLWFLFLSTRGQAYPINPPRVWCVYFIIKQHRRHFDNSLIQEHISNNVFSFFWCSNIRFSPCMTPKRQTWPVLSRSSWMTDGLPPGLRPVRVGGTSQQNEPMAYLF